jgi:glutamyl-tRNA synthetase
VNKAASAFNPEKLLWLNQQHIMKAPRALLVAALKDQLAMLGVATADEALLGGVVEAMRERAKTMKEMAATTRFFFEDIAVDQKAAAKHLNADGLVHLRGVREALAGLAAFDAASIHAELNARATAAGVGLGKLAQPLRVAVTGGTVSPPIDQTVALLGRERALSRIDAALARVP